jgi:hypothetical protein
MSAEFADLTRCASTGNRNPDFCGFADVVLPIGLYYFAFVVFLGLCLTDVQ